eukprot:scaffold4575_cov94-Alexandrium_tamarense.AAC.1
MECRVICVEGRLAFPGFQRGLTLCLTGIEVYESLDHQSSLVTLSVWSVCHWASVELWLNPRVLPEHVPNGRTVYAAKGAIRHGSRKHFEICCKGVVL